MFIFKTSGETYDSVIRNEAHAFRGEPQEWFPGEIILVSKNRSSLRPGEKQISRIMRFRNVRRLKPGEAERLWPGNEGRWNYLVECSNTERLAEPFDLEDVLGEEAERYKPIVTAGKIKPEHEKILAEKLSQYDGEPYTSNPIPAAPQPENPTPLTTANKLNNRSFWLIILLLICAFLAGAILF